MRPHGLKPLGQDCFAGQAQIGRCARDADIEKPQEQAGNAFGHAVDAASNSMPLMRCTSKMRDKVVGEIGIIFQLQLRRHAGQCAVSLR
jgi:hypothetical protein